MLSEFVTVHREELIARCSAKVAARMAKPPTDVLRGIPLFLDQLVATLDTKHHSESAATTAATTHGAELLLKGFTIGQVVHDYGDVCQSLTGLAMEHSLAVTTEEFQLLNLCLDDAIAGAVTEYARQRELDIMATSRIRANDDVGLQSYELRNLVWSATLAFEALKTGNVGISGNTGAMVTRSLASLRNLIERSFTAMKLKDLDGTRERITIAELIEVIRISVMAPVLGPVLSVELRDGDAVIDADLQLLAPIVVRLVQNAYDHTHARGHVTLRGSATETRVQIEIEDECGGLQPGTVMRLESHHADGAHRNHGLRGIGSLGGTIAVRDLPGKGCVFTVDMPRASAVAPAGSESQRASSKHPV